MRGSDLLILAGVALIAAGVLARFGLLAWFGNLPGDIRFEGENSRGFIPITSMILVSIALSAAANLLLRFFRD
jgi:hypothetical protein